MRSKKQLIILFLMVFSSLIYSQEKTAGTIKDFRKKLSAEIKQNYALYNLPGAARVDSVYFDDEKNLVLLFNKRASGKPFREWNIADVTKKLTEFVGKNGFEKDGLKIYFGSFQLKDMVPNYYRVNIDIDKARLPIYNRSKSFVVNNSRPFEIEDGLEKSNIALWSSHGWYYSHEDDRWQWQRARLYGTVEDLLTTSIVLPYLLPMLENAGARVYLPRERDLQTSSVVVDVEGVVEGGSVEGSEKWEKTGIGFLNIATGYEANVNPFLLGKSIQTIAKSNEKNPLRYLPNIPEKGEYAVYISYSKDVDGKNVNDVKYTVRHAGGNTEFTVNQKVGWGTWIYLGTFEFEKGTNRDNASVEVSDESEFEGMITSDAIRFGGGMGVVKRGGRTSGRPKFAEAARYYMQYLGMPDTLVYNIHKDVTDYLDDFRGRSEFVNFLNGSPNGPNKQKDNIGLRIPIDLSLGWHTDAGVLGGDSIVGTLMIYSSVGIEKNVFPDGRTRMANRDLGDIVQTQIVEDIQKLFDGKWVRRDLMDADYAEASRGNVPSILLELLSHQNFAEMKFFWDPKFKFAVSRAIYKGILRFISDSYSQSYKIQPLPVDNFSAVLKDDVVDLSWKPVLDPLEEYAIPKGFVVYRRLGSGGFDNGTYTSESKFKDKNIPQGEVISYKITAVNDGGESFPSEILSVGISKDRSKKMLIVNAFDRLSGPEFIQKENYEGFQFNVDEGVQYKKDIAYTGEQVNFDRNSEFISNDAPGFGASKSDQECKVSAGNSFDYPAIHGEAILKAGYSFSSCSDESIESGEVQLNQFDFVDIIGGEEKFTKTSFGLQPVVREDYRLFTPAFLERLKNYLVSGKALFMSGAYIGTELQLDTNSNKFGVTVLKSKLGTEFATTLGDVFGVTKAIDFAGISYKFNTSISDKIYKVEAPQAINPEKGGETLLRYTENTNSAMVGFKGDYKSVVAGFPFETILGAENRQLFMKTVLKYLGL